MPLLARQKTSTFCMLDACEWPSTASPTITRMLEFVGMRSERLGGQKEYAGVQYRCVEGIHPLARAHVWLDKPAGNDLAEFTKCFARARKLNVQLSYMYRYDPGFRFVLDWATSGRYLLHVRRARKATGSHRACAPDHLHPLVDIIGRFWDGARVTLSGTMLRASRPSRSSGARSAWYYNNTAAIRHGTLESRVRRRRFEVYGTRGSDPGAVREQAVAVSGPSYGYVSTKIETGTPRAGRRCRCHRPSATSPASLR